jgi:Xaa-Pro aminopeptidase
MEHVKERRARLFELMGEGVAILQAATIIPTNNGNEYPFHQSPNFYYLSGSNEPGAILVMQKHGDLEETVLFVRPKDEKAEQWTGRRLGPEASVGRYEVDRAFPLGDFDKELPKLLRGNRKAFIELFVDQPIRSKVFNACRNYAGMTNLDEFLPQEFGNIEFLLGQMRLRKDPDEIQAIRQGIEISSKAYEAVLAFMEPGKNERDLHDLLELGFRRNGGAGSAYIPIVAGGDSANIMHYIANDRELVDGELVLIDAGAEFEGVACDITRTFPVNGSFSPEQRQVYTIVLDSIKAGLDEVAHGKTLQDIDVRCKRVLTEGLIQFGVLEGSVEEHVEKKSVSKYCPYGVSHWLGLNIHDRCARVDSEGEPIANLASGMIFTIEPGLYLPENDEDVPEEFRGIGVRIEDDVLITEDGFVNLTDCVAKEIDDIERLWKAPYSSLL